MNHKSFRIGSVLLLALMFLLIPLVVFGQTNGTAFDPGNSTLPTGTSGYWDYGIALVTPVLVWLFAKFGPSVPVMVLPLLAPAFGLILGFALNKLGAANLSWVDMTKAGGLAVFIRELVNQLVTKRINGETIQTTAKAAAMIMLLGLMSMGFVGCGSQTLEQGGAYNRATFTTNADLTVTTNAIAAPDMTLYKADAAFDFANTSILSATQFERENRALLWSISPDIKHKLDDLRAQYVVIAKEWAVARKAYIASPVPANADSMTTVLAKIKAINAAVLTAIPNRK
jgi:hypothetical protein